MGGSYFADGGVLHAKTMLAYHRDGYAVSRSLMVMFTGVLMITGWLWFDTGSVPFAFSGGVAIILIALGLGLHIHHGKQITVWADKLEVYERIQRDRRIHARTLKGWEL